MSLQRDAESTSIFERQETGLYRLKAGVSFHMYISTAPCGDARLFSPNESRLEDDHPCRLSNKKM